MMDVGSWLRGLGLERYEAAFRENEIDETVLPTLTADDLKDLGVGFVGHRRVPGRRDIGLFRLSNHARRRCRANRAKRSGQSQIEAWVGLINIPTPCPARSSIVRRRRLRPARVGRA